MNLEVCEDSLERRDLFNGLLDVMLNDTGASCQYQIPGDEATISVKNYHF